MKTNGWKIVQIVQLVLFVCFSVFLFFAAGRRAWGCADTRGETYQLCDMDDLLPWGFSGGVAGLRYRSPLQKIKCILTKRD